MYIFQLRKARQNAQTYADERLPGMIKKISLAIEKASKNGKTSCIVECKNKLVADMCVKQFDENGYMVHVNTSSQNNCSFVYVYWHEHL